mmetsp:Transcript_8967/g.33079  ORF Transcript_8967/g.33079 Transcript_8967/m.33079 type:complete len:850 (-) Transcript_8967:735-3284(-)|eukprot:CAMPEP_0117449958 /NCGR_PEP_ID=MMETSP0759-20121206/8217_1 /TAXON_ID=63605 /ORGANISM="Percolomonas cosmopolitus, Strain WS" /LENGTH=849 /DNA_ID=CAMNT_0005242457 /DNA_START=191 /DNA_END=2740 /DNA_ORIENTATION=+
MDLTEFLVNATHPDATIRQNAENGLSQALQHNYPVYLVSLVNELANEAKPQQARQMAGILLKQQFQARSQETKQRLASQWMESNDQLKAQIRSQIITTLSSQERDARRTSALVLSAIANIDLPQNQWTDIVPRLAENVTNGENPFAMEASLMALGYICEETRAPALTAQTDNILNAVAKGMSTNQAEIRLAATNALFNCLEFTEKNFQNEGERTYIMKLACESCEAPEADTRRVALQCLVKIAYLYYETLPAYVQRIFEITIKCARQDQEPVALQAVEFWTTVAEVESDIQDELDDLAEGEEPERSCHNFVPTALGPLVELLTELLVKQEEYQSDDDNNISNAAGTCLSYVSHAVGDQIVERVMPFIYQNIKSQDWHFKEAATLAFSAILDGPKSSQINDLVDKAIPSLLEHVRDPMPLVKDTTIFTLGRIAHFQPVKLIDNHLHSVLEALVVSMKDSESRVASKACWAIHNIAESLDQDQNANTNTNQLSKYFSGLCQALLECSTRPDISENNLRLNVYEAIGSLINSAAQDQYSFLQEKIVSQLLHRLQGTITNSPPSDETALVQGLLCGTLQVCTEKLKVHIQNYADELMKTYLTLFNQSPAIFDDIMMAVGSLIDGLEKNFVRYMQHFHPYLLKGLTTYREEQVCATSVNVVGALCGALENGMNQFSDDIMRALLGGLQSNETSDEVKPNMISCFSDIALAIGGEFEKYTQHVAGVLVSASQLQVNPEDEDKIEYQNILRENILEAYSGILQGVKSDKPQAFNQFIDPVFAFLYMISKDSSTDKDVFKAAVTLIGDLANVYGTKLQQYLNKAYIFSMIADAKESDDNELKTKGFFATEQMQRVNP